MKKTEIEYKFLFGYVPFDELEYRRKTVVYRSYLSCNPEVRLNKRRFEDGEERFHLTVKSEGYLCRKEIKIPIEESQYEDLCSLTGREPLIMDIYEFKFDSTHIISFKQGVNFDVQFAEIECDNVEDAAYIGKKIKELPYFVKDVTYDSSYYVKNIWAKMKEIYNAGK